MEIKKRKKERLEPWHKTLQITTASKYLKFTSRNVVAIQYLYTSSRFPPLLWAVSLWHFSLGCKVLKAAFTCLSLLIKQRFFEWSWIWYRLCKPCIRNNAASLQEAMFSVIQHRRGDTLSDCWRDHKCLRPVCMCMKQFVSLYKQLTPRSPQTWPPSIKG